MNPAFNPELFSYYLNIHWMFVAMRKVSNKLLQDQFIRRWSPRSFQVTPLTDEEIQSLFEAARWSPSCFN